MVSCTLCLKDAKGIWQGRKTRDKIRVFEFFFDVVVGANDNTIVTSIGQRIPGTRAEFGANWVFQPLHREPRRAMDISNNIIKKLIHTETLQI